MSFLKSRTQQFHKMKWYKILAKQRQQWILADQTYFYWWTEIKNKFNYFKGFLNDIMSYLFHKKKLLVAKYLVFLHETIKLIKSIE